MQHTCDAAACLVVIRGVLDPHWGDYLEGMTIISRPSSAPEERVGDMASTILSGPVKDFAAFVGLIGWLQNLGLPVQTVTFHQLPASSARISDF